MPILGCTSLEEAFALHQAELRRAGKRGEFYDHVCSFPMVPIYDATPTREDFLRRSAVMDEVKMLVHKIMPRPGKQRHNEL